MKAISKTEVERRLNLLYEWLNKNPHVDYLYGAVEIEFDQYNALYWESKPKKRKTNLKHSFCPKTEYYSMIETNQI